MNIDAAKKYQTRSGLPARIYATDGREPYQIHGSYRSDEGWICGEWAEDGAFHQGASGTHSLDLIPVKTWRAWKKGEAPARIMLQQKGFVVVETKRTKDCDLPTLFLHYVRVHEDNTKTPCGVEE